MISEKLSRFNNYFPVAVAYLILHAVRLRISDEQVLALEAMLAAWTPIWEKYADPTTQTHGSIKDINDLYDEDNHYMDKIKLQLKHDMNVSLSGNDHVAIAIHEDLDPRGVVPAHGFSPNGMVIRQGHLSSLVSVSDTQEGHTNDKSKPKDVGRIGMKSVILPADSPPPVAGSTLFQNMIPSGTIHVNLKFTDADVGKKCYIIFWYENPKGDKRSPESKMLMVPVI